MSHRLISSIYSALQANYADLGYGVRRVMDESEAGYSLLAEMHMDHASQYACFKVVGDNDIADFPSAMDSFMSVPLNFEPDQVEKIAVIEEKDRQQALSRSISSTSYNFVIWSVSFVDGIIRKAYGNHLNSRTDRIMASGLYFPEMFPFPYYGFMHPLHKFEIVSLGFSISGKQELKHVLEAASEMAYYNSVGYERQEIRSDLLNLVRSMIRMGVISGKGDLINLPSSVSSFTDNFIRKYTSYMERAAKKTIFDFESLI